MEKKRNGPDRVGRWLLVVAALGVAGIILMRLLPAGSASGEGVGEAGAVSGGEGAAVEPKASAFRKVQGRWLRPDGGYILDLKWVGDDGRVEASYLNPRSIYVSRAEASEDGGRIKLLVELQDVGYPGCVYTLHHDAERDVLVGDYYQAAMQETFDVEFVRTE